MDKAIANEIQQLTVFHRHQYGSRKGRSTIDMAIQATTETQLERTKGKSCAWALRYIKSVFNYTWKSNVLDRLAKHQGMEGLRRYVHWFYQPRSTELTWDRQGRMTTTVKSRVP